MSLCTTVHPLHTIFTTIIRYLYFRSDNATEPQVQVDLAQWDKLRDAYRRAMRRQREAAAPDQVYHDFTELRHASPG